MLTPQLKGAKERRQGEIILENNTMLEEQGEPEIGAGGTHLFVHFNVKAVGHLVILKQVKNQLLQTDKVFDIHEMNAKSVTV